MRIHARALAAIWIALLATQTNLTRCQEATSANLPERLEASEPTPKASHNKPPHHRKLRTPKTTETPVAATEQTPTAQEAAPPSTPPERKARARKRVLPAVRREPVTSPTPTQMSLSSAQALAVTAPLPEYPYEAKHANATGSGICVVTVDTTSGKVTNAMMAQSTGNAVLDKVTTETFRRWRFKPGSVSQVRVPISYE
jgi:TonB family protein